MPLEWVGYNAKQTKRTDCTKVYTQRDIKRKNRNQVYDSIKAEYVTYFLRSGSNTNEVLDCKQNRYNDLGNVKNVTNERRQIG